MPSSRSATASAWPPKASATRRPRGPKAPGASWRRAGRGKEGRPGRLLQASTARVHEPGRGVRPDGRHLRKEIGMTESTVNIEMTHEETSAPATGATVPDILRETGSAQAYRERDPVGGPGPASGATLRQASSVTMGGTTITPIPLTLRPPSPDRLRS